MAFELWNGFQLNHAIGWNDEFCHANNVRIQVNGACSGITHVRSNFAQFHQIAAMGNIRSRCETDNQLF